MKVLPAFLLLKQPWDCGQWLHIKESISQDQIAGLKAHHYQIDLRPMPSEGRESFFNRVRGIILGYRIYPPARMRACICNDLKQISPGATIVQRILLGPIGIEAAVRVLDVFDRKEEKGREAGFSYITLKGHPERGIIQFCILQNGATPDIQLKIETRSIPDSIFLRILSPLSNRIQRASNTQALNHVRQQVENLK